MGHQSLSSSSSHSRMNTEVLEHQVSCPYPFGCQGIQNVCVGVPVHITGFFTISLFGHSILPAHPSFYLLSPRFTGSWGSVCRSAPRPPITVSSAIQAVTFFALLVNSLLLTFETLFQKFVKIMKQMHPSPPPPIVLVVIVYTLSYSFTVILKNLGRRGKHSRTQVCHLEPQTKSIICNIRAGDSLNILQQENSEINEVTSIAWDALH